jgi:hypothetical protein
MSLIPSLLISCLNIETYTLPEAAPFLQLLLLILWQLRCGRMTKVTKVVDKITAGCLAGIS